MSMKIGLISTPTNDYTLSLPIEIWYKIISDDDRQIGCFLCLNKHIQAAFDIFASSPVNIHRRKFKPALSVINSIKYEVFRGENDNYGYEYGNKNTYDWSNSMRKFGSKTVVYDQYYDATDEDYNESAYRFVNYQQPTCVYVFTPDIIGGSIWNNEPSSPIWIANIEISGDIEISKTEWFNLDDFIEKNKVKIGKIDDESDWWSPYECGTFRKDSWLNHSKITYYMDYIPAFMTMVIEDNGKLERKAITYMNNDMFD